MLRSFLNWVNSAEVEKYLQAPRIFPKDITEKSDGVYFSSEFADPSYPNKRYYMMISACADGWLATKYVSDHSRPDQPAEVDNSGAGGHPQSVIACLAGFEKESRRVKMTEIKQSKPNYNEFAARFGFFVTPHGEVLEIKKDRPITHEAKIDQKSQKALFSRTDGDIKDWHDLYRFLDGRISDELNKDPEALNAFAALQSLYVINKEMPRKIADFNDAFKNVCATPHLHWMHDRETISRTIIDWHWADRLPPMVCDVYIASGLVAYLRAGGQAFNACIASGMGKREMDVMAALKDETQAVARNLGMSTKQVEQVTDLFVRGQDHMAPHYPLEHLMKKAMDIRAELEIKWAEERRIAKEKRIQGLREAAAAFLKPISNQKCLPPGRSDDPNAEMRVWKTDANGKEVDGSVYTVKSPVATLYTYGKMSATFNSEAGRKYTLNNLSDKIDADMRIHEADQNVSVSVTHKDAVPSMTRSEHAKFAADTGDVSAEVTADGKVAFSGTIKKEEPKKKSLFGFGG